MERVTDMIATPLQALPAMAAGHFPPAGPAELAAAADFAPVVRAFIEKKRAALGLGDFIGERARESLGHGAGRHPWHFLISFNCAASGRVV